MDWATVDRVEPFRGPASSLYGGGGAGGIVNNTTREALRGVRFWLETL